MRFPWLQFTIKRMMIAVALSGVASWAFGRYHGWTYYDSGWWEAERELWRGEATIYESGGLTYGDICHVDRETGLPINVVSGCVVQAGEGPRIKGHNDHIAQFIRWHGLPRNTLKPWENELFNLARYFDERSHIESPTRLIAGGAAPVSPDGRNSVRAVAHLRDDGSQSKLLTLVISAGDVVVREGFIFFGGDSHLHWGPAGSRFFVVRTVSGKIEHYKAYDLRNGWCLREETWVAGKNKGEREPYDPLGKTAYLDPYDLPLSPAPLNPQESAKPSPEARQSHVPSPCHPQTH